jgi:hypothetical protein
MLLCFLPVFRAKVDVTVLLAASLPYDKWMLLYFLPVFRTKGIKTAFKAGVLL